MSSWEDVVEQEEDLSDVAALAAIAMLQGDTESVEERPRRRTPPVGKEERQARPQSNGQGRRREGSSPKRRSEHFDKNGRQRKEKEAKGGRHASHDRSPRREEGRGRGRRPRITEPTRRTPISYAVFCLKKKKKKKK